MLNIAKRLFVGLLVGVSAYAILLVLILTLWGGMNESWSFIWMLFVCPILAIIAAIKATVTVKYPSNDFVLWLLIGMFGILLLSWVMIKLF